MHDPKSRAAPGSHLSARLRKLIVSVGPIFLQFALSTGALAVIDLLGRLLLDIWKEPITREIRRGMPLPPLTEWLFQNYLRRSSDTFTESLICVWWLWIIYLITSISIGRGSWTRTRRKFTDSLTCLWLAMLVYVAFLAISALLPWLSTMDFLIKQGGPLPPFVRAIDQLRWLLPLAAALLLIYRLLRFRLRRPTRILPPT